MSFDYQKSIDFLLENGREVIQYRLHKEILRDLTEAEEAVLLDKVMQTPDYRLLMTHVKPNGYIGTGTGKTLDLRNLLLQTQTRHTGIDRDFTLGSLDGRVYHVDSFALGDQITLARRTHHEYINTRLDKRTDDALYGLQIDRSLFDGCSHRNYYTRILSLTHCYGRFYRFFVISSSTLLSSFTCTIPIGWKRMSLLMAA